MTGAATALIKGVARVAVLNKFVSLTVNGKNHNETFADKNL